MHEYTYKQIVNASSTIETISPKSGKKRSSATLDASTMMTPLHPPKKTNTVNEDRCPLGDSELQL